MAMEILLRSSGYLRPRAGVLIAYQSIRFLGDKEFWELADNCFGELFCVACLSYVLPDEQIQEWETMSLRRLHRCSLDL